MFNLSKHADFAGIVQDVAGELEQGIEDPINTQLEQEDIQPEAGPQQPGVDDTLELAEDRELMGFLQELQASEGLHPGEVNAISTVMQNNDDFQTLKQQLKGLPEAIEDDKLQTLAPLTETTPNYRERAYEIRQAVQNLSLKRQEWERSQLPMAAFNLRKHKTAQMVAPQQMQPIPPQPMMENQERFPVANEGDFIQKFLKDLLAYNAQPGTGQYERARKAVEEIRQAVSPGFEEEANSALESIMQLDPMIDEDRAAKDLMKVFQVLIPPILKEQSEMEPVTMDKNPDGIIRYNLSDHILNNKKAVKTAQQHFGTTYMLYGPTEKRICPKLRGKNLSVGDVVSEETCRNHCIDGIVIDDNKTICGEALWRAHAADKFSREYVDEEGKIVGGYLNKRFEINRNVPEENRARLKPGELRKPLPPSARGYEARLQDMRSKEGKSRNYRPDVNTGQAFRWDVDVDQNNVEVSQQERDRREEASGHKLVQYTDRDQGENNPKKAFNLKQHTKTAQSRLDEHVPAVSQVGIGNIAAPPNTTPAQTYDSGKPMPKPMSLSDMETEKYDFAAGEAKARELDEPSLLYVIKELEEVIEAQEEMTRAGHSTQKLGYYHDQRHTYIQEVMRKRQGKALQCAGPVASGFNLKQYKTAQETFDPPGLASNIGIRDRWKNRQTNVNTGQLPPGWDEAQIIQLAGALQKLGNVPEKAQQMAVELAWKASELNTDPNEVIAQHGAYATQVNDSERGRPTSPVTWQNQGTSDDFGSSYASANITTKEAKSPPGFKHTVEHMKAKHGDEIDEPFALGWWMKNKGYESHKGPDDVDKCDDKDMKAASKKKK